MKNKYIFYILKKLFFLTSQNRIPITKSTNYLNI